MRVWITRHTVVISYLTSFLIIALAYPVAHALKPAQESDIADSPYLRNDPEKIVLSDRDDRVPCGECHTLEYDVWRETPHSTGFDTMHRSKQAQGILERMEFRLAKRESLCLRCHYTATIQRETAKAIAGVSCESCHGAARDWQDLHNDYGQGFTHETEPAAHKAERIVASNNAGMLRPSDNLYGVAANCFECHTVPSEELVDVGKHASGSDFELVEWSEKIRHNFLEAQWSNNETNRLPAAERKRVMYVVGRMLDYEYSIRGLAEASSSGRYAKAMERRVTSAVRELDKIAFLHTIPEVASIIQAHKDVQLIPNNKDALLQVAENVRAQGQQFTQSNDGSQIASIDRLVAGEVVNLPRPVTEPPPATASASPEPSPSGTTPAAPSAEANTPAAAPPPATPAFQVAGQKRTKPAWHTESQYQTTLANCARCHTQADEWLLGDAHYSSTRVLHEETSEAVRIASNYGLSRTEMKQGDQICMQCHGTIPSGQEAAIIFDGVTCESCHGPSSGYEKPHKKDRTKGYDFGMVALKQPDVLAANCSKCHYITDDRLISSGHPTGSDYNIRSGHQSIKHWPDDENIERDAPYQEIDLNAVANAFASIQASRSIPQVPIAPLQPVQQVASRTPATPSSGGGAPAARRQVAIDRSPSVAPQPPPNRPTRRIARPAPTRTQSIDLPPLPAVSDSTSTEDILLIVKERLELLYKALGRNE